MKSSFFSLLLFLPAVWPVAGQAPIGNDKATVIERGPHHAQWYWTTEQSLPDGRVTPEEHSAIEVATGLNFLVDGKEGQWAPSKEGIEIFPDGAIARQTQHKVIWAPNVNTDGAVDLLMPDGQRLRSHVAGIAYTDAATGKSVLIAEPKDSTGEVGGNQVIYRDAFSGPFRADVRYTHSKAGMEQDVILHQKPPPPSDYGLNTATTRLEVWSEFLAPPVPTIKEQVLRQETDPLVRQAMVMPDLVDQTVNFGSMQIGSGQAFSLDGPDGSTVAVAKSWVRLNGQQFLIEAVEFPRITPFLQALQQAAAPARQQNAELKTAVKNRQEMARALLRAPTPNKKEKKIM